MEGPGTSEVQRIHRDAIPLLCSIFLANQGAGEAAEEGRLLLSVSICILIFFFHPCILKFGMYFSYLSGLDISWTHYVTWI